MLVIALMVLFSTVSSSNTDVLLGTGGVVLASYLVGLLPKCSKYMSTFLMNGNSLIYGVAEEKSYIAAVVITAGVSLMCFAVSVFAFNRKQI